MVREGGFVKHELAQAATKGEATKKVKAMYPDMTHLETTVVELSEGERNKAKALHEAETNELGKLSAEEKQKREKKSKDKKNKKKE
jgi:hypothetical protein